MLADVNVSLPLGPIDRELIRLAKDSGGGAPWKAEVVVWRLCGSTESTETMEGVLERTGETMWSLSPQETMFLAIGRRERDEENEIVKGAACLHRFCRVLNKRRPSHVTGKSVLVKLYLHVGNNLMVDRLLVFAGMLYTTFPMDCDSKPTGIFFGIQYKQRDENKNVESKTPGKAKAN